MPVFSLLALTVNILTVNCLKPKDGKTGKLPALGFNSWNAFRCDIHEDKFLVRYFANPPPRAPRVCDIYGSGIDLLNIANCRSQHKRLLIWG